MADEGNAGGVVLEARGATARFGAYTAVDAASWSLREGETAGIIGPNGAGKSTFFNLLTGWIRPAGGIVLLHGRDVTRVPPHRRVRLGLVRTFQLVSVFDELPVLENLVLAVVRADPPLARGLRFCLGSSRGRELVEACAAALERVGLAGKRDVLTSELSYGDKRKLEIAMALASRPRALLLDEPLAGLSDVEIREVLTLIRTVQGALSMVIIEHKVSHLVDLASRLSVMHEGRFIADGRPREVLGDPTVRQIYWGREGGRVAASPASLQTPRPGA
jgi:branched-chain amino acid transport system ATP-binding protein